MKGVLLTLILAGLCAAQSHPKVVFIGDSITARWKPFFPGKGYLNRGVGGQVTAQMLERFPTDVLSVHPAVVVIQGGTNDIGHLPDSFPDEVIENNLSAMAQMARSHGIRVILASIISEGSDWDRQLPLRRILAVNTWLQKFAAENGFIYLDYFSETVDERGFMRPELSKDGQHPNESGYAIMSPLARKAIAAALKTRTPPDSSR